MKLSELKNEEVMNIIREYYEDKITVKELLNKYGMDYSSNFIHKVNLYSEYNCEICDGKIKYILESRTYCKSFDMLKAKCSECGHDGSEYCYCKKCVEDRNIEIEKRDIEKKKVIEKYFYKKPISFNELSIKEIIFLGILKEKGIMCNLGILAEKDYFKNVHSYIGDSLKFLKSLSNNNVIKVNIDESDLEKFKIEEGNEIAFYPYLIAYRLNLKEDLSTIDIKSELLNNFSRDELAEAWRGICLDECLRYLDIRTKAMDLEIVEGELRKEISYLIEEILLEYSSGEVINIIYRSVNYASNFKVEQKVKNEKVHKAIYTNIKNHITRNYKTIAYDRPYELIATSLYEYFCNNIFELDSDEIFRNTNSLDILYSSDRLEDGSDRVEGVVEAYKKVVLDIKDLISKEIPKEFIIKYLNITEEIYNDAKEKMYE